MKALIEQRRRDSHDDAAQHAHADDLVVDFVVTGDDVIDRVENQEAHHRR